MNFYADYVRNKLNAAISSMSSQIEDYVKNPGHDFTRNRKMNFTSTINFLLTMEGGSLNSELHKYFNYDLNQIPWNIYFTNFMSRYYVTKNTKAISYLPVMVLT